MRAIGSLMILSITIICILADLDMIILSLDAMGLGSGKGGIFTSLGINPADAMGIALIGSSIVWGALLLDIFGITTWIPENLIENAAFRKVILIIGVSMILLATVALAGLASYRFSSINFDEAEMENITNLNLNPNEITLMTSEKSGIVHFIFVFISIFTLLTSIIGAILLPSALLVIVCILLGILMSPVAICFFIFNLFDRLVTLLFNITLAAFNLLTGIFNGLSQVLQKKLNVDDTVEDLPEETQNQDTSPLLFPSRVNSGNENRELRREVTTQNSEITHAQSDTEQNDVDEQIDENNQEAPLDVPQGFDESGFNPLTA